MSSLLSLAGNAAPTGFYDFPINQSLRFEDGDSAYLSRTPASAGNRKTWTWSGWVKRGNLGLQRLFTAGTSGSSYIQIRFDTNDEILCSSEQPSQVLYLQTTQKFRDPSAWYHIVVAMDTTQSTAADRTKLYINGSLVTDFSSSTRPAQNTDLLINSTTAHMIGALSYGTTSSPYGGYMAEINFIDGTAYDASSFGETKSGIWVPKDTSGLTYGTNGFRLAFADSAAIGDDTSGNTNDFTANNLVASDVVLDSPTNNFCTISPLMGSSSYVKSEGNTKVNYNSASWLGSQLSTMGMTTGKYYWEVYVNSADNSTPIRALLGIESSANNYSGSVHIGNLANSVSIYSVSTAFYQGGSATYDAEWVIETGDTVMFAYDADNGTLWIGKDGTWWNGATAAEISAGTTTNAMTTGLDTSLTWLAGCTVRDGGTVTFNFGQDSTFAGLKAAGGNADENGYGDFAHSVPSGYLSLCSANLPSGAIDTLNDETPEDYFNTVLYTGNATTATSITSVGFQPSLTWIKNRTDIVDHVITDAVRGATIRLESNSTDAEITQTEDLQSFDADGFTVGNQNRVNGSSDAMVAWNWKANGAGVSNTDGSITSTVSVGATSQQNWFSVVSYVGNGTAGATVGHGLNTQPSMIIAKNRDDGTKPWTIYHEGVHPTDPADYRLQFDTSGITNDNTVWNDTEPTSSVFTLGSTTWHNASGNNIIAYCFANAEGLCKVGKYTGNGSTDGTFVFTGHRPAFLITKHISTGNWAVWDNRRDPENVVDNLLYPNLSNAQNTGTDRFDFLSNGFKCKNTNDANAWNASGVDYIFLSIAEQPFKYSNAR